MQLQLGVPLYLGCQNQGTLTFYKLIENSSSYTNILEKAYNIICISI